MSTHAIDRPGGPRWTQRELRRGPWPIVVTLVLSLAALLAWRTVTDPGGPSKFTKYDPHVGRLFAPTWAKVPLYLYGDAEPDGLLVVGDSRASATVSIRVLRAQGVEPVAVLWNGLAQLSDLVRAARELPPRRLLLSLTPAGVHAPSLARMEALLRVEREKSPMVRIDERLDDELDVFRERLLRTIDFNDWLRDPSLTAVQPKRQEGLYDQLLAEPTRARRLERLGELEADLARLRDDGWKIACVRLPLESGLEEVEDKGFPRELFTAMCARLDVPYLDMFDRDYRTSDGSHLIGYEADRASVAIAAWLKTLGW